MREPTHMTLLIDGDCPLCSREAAFLARRDKAGRLAFQNIASDAFDPAAVGKTRDELLAAIHAILPDGSVVSGMEVFRRAYRAVGLGWLIAPTGWPVIKPLADAAYRLFARHRPRLKNRPCPDGSCALRWSSQIGASRGQPEDSSATR